MSRPFEPLLATSEDPLSYPRYFEELLFPLRVSPKIDGIRCVIRGGKACSRKLIPFPNKNIQRLFGELEFLDGELGEGIITDWDLCHRTGGYARSHDKIGDMHYYVFDETMEDDKDLPFEERLEVLKELVEYYSFPNVHIVEQAICNTIEELLDYEEFILSLGFEGVMPRNPRGVYKYGRTTWREQNVMKLKRFAETEGIIVGFEEKVHNLNEDVRSETGKAKRGYKLENMVPAGTLGKFLVDIEGVVEKVAPGAFKHDELQVIWDNASWYLGKTLTVRHTPHGAKNGLRQARAVGFRDLKKGF